MRWLRRWVEKWLGRFYEGPLPPDRLIVMVEEYAKHHPTASVQEWARFAAAHACEAYRNGYINGVEYVERDPDQWYPKVDPALIADAEHPGWREAEPYRFNELSALPPPLEPETEEQKLMRQFAAVKGDRDGLVRIEE